MQLLKTIGQNMMYMVKDKEIQSVDETQNTIQENPQVVKPGGASEAHTRERQYTWKNPNSYMSKAKIEVAVDSETIETEGLVQEINRRIQKGDIRLMYGTDANDKEIVVYQTRNQNSKSNFDTGEGPSTEFIKGEKVHAEDLRLFRHVFDEQEVKDIKRARKTRKEKEE